MRHIILLLLLMAPSLSAIADDGKKLTGTVIGTEISVDYTTLKESTTANTREMAFDGDLNTCFASYERSYTWAGLDLGSKHIITKVGWAPRNYATGPKRVQLGVFEGANREDFMDALPLYIITEEGVIGQMSYATVNCSRGFRYVRYVGPSDVRCNVAELEFYGVAGEGDDTHLSQLTNLPTVSIHTLNGEIPYDKEHDIQSQIAIISDNGTKLLYQPGGIRERGNTSRAFPKKPYRIKFEKKQNVLDAPVKAKKWTLINNYGDKTLMRNLLAFDLSRRMGMPYTPYGAAVDVLLNGEYKGCYQLCDQIEVNPGRVEITEMTPEDNSGEALTGGYFIEVDAYANDETSKFTSIMGNPVTIKSPDEDKITNEQHEYIQQYFNMMEKDWKTYLDLNTFLRHFLVGELSGNSDTYWSTYMYKDRGEDIIHTGPVWDFDLAFENDQRSYPIMEMTDYVYATTGSCAGNMRMFVNSIVKDDEDVKAQLLDIWDEVRQGGLTAESMTADIDLMEQQLQQSQRLNFLRWPIMDEIVHGNPVIWGSYEAEVQNVRRYVQERIVWMDNKLGYTYIPSGILPSPSTLYPASSAIYTLDGRYVGNKVQDLSAGIYIVGGKKVIIR